jgi:hypothetical protein
MENTLGKPGKLPAILDRCSVAILGRMLSGIMPLCVASIKEEHAIPAS